MATFDKVLDTYGRLVGEWQMKITYYGGLLEVKLEAERLVGIEWQVTNDDSNVLQRGDMFSIGLDSDGDIEILCLRGYQGPHPCQLTIFNDWSFNVTCEDFDCHLHPGGDDDEFEELCQKVGGREMSYVGKECLHEKYLHIKRYEDTFDMRRLELSGSPVLIPLISPGLFQGTFGGYGQEIVAITYEYNGIFVKAIKISGDPYIPYGEVTFYANLHCSLVLEEDEQTTFEILSQVPQMPAHVNPMELHVQPFVVPLDAVPCGGCNLDDLPDQCIARFFGHAQNAGFGHTNPSYREGHWVIFNENLFAFLNIETTGIHVYHRLQKEV